MTGLASTLLFFEFTAFCIPVIVPSRQFCTILTLVTLPRASLAIHEDITEMLPQ
jgi:hypothetical protein